MIKEFHNINLQDRNSFHVVQTATRLVEFDTEADLKEFFEQGIPTRWTVLSGGNNILFTQDYQGVLLTPKASNIEIISEQGDHALVRAEAGLEWDDLVAWTVDHQLWGLENLSLIPGKVGAAPVQNIGAYGSEAKDSIECVELFCIETQNTLILSKEHCLFGYRESIFKHALKGKVIITAVTFGLSRSPHPNLGYGDLIREVEARGGATLQNIRAAVCAIRHSKLPDPEKVGNAGSFFKNPVVDSVVAEHLRADYPDIPLYPVVGAEGKVKLASGWLIDRCGLKGTHQGKVGIHDRQALVLINLGGATGGEVIDFAHHIQAAVEKKFGVHIDTEVNIL
ncbi:MAG: UDP-N-acetylmuramate dehydrogenase [Alistipes sp.]